MVLSQSIVTWGIRNSTYEVWMNKIQSITDIIEISISKVNRRHKVKKETCKTKKPNLEHLDNLQIGEKRHTRQ